MRVDNVPFWLRPWFNLWGYSTGLGFLAWVRYLQRSLTIEAVGPGCREEQAIYCVWHEDLLPLFLAMPHLNGPQIWMNHPLWYMQPVHVFLNRIGVGELVLGSTGHEGKAALSQLARRLMETGRSTAIAVDGPSGPAHFLRKGCLYLAQSTQIPIVPLRFICSSEYRVPINWDKKRAPRIGSNLTVVGGDPMHVGPDVSLESAARELAVALSAAVSSEVEIIAPCAASSG